MPARLEVIASECRFTMRPEIVSIECRDRCASAWVAFFLTAIVYCLGAPQLRGSSNIKAISFVRRVY